jgi:HD-like signal output (HDOD) protein
MQRELLEYGLQEGELWRHSVAAAVAVDQGRKFCRVPMAPEAFCAALLHDTGKFVLASHLGQQGAESLQRTGEHQDLSDEQAERKVLQICHTELGARLAKGWRLREGTADGIQYHHAPLLGPTPQARRLGTQVALGDAVARAIGLDCGTGSGASFNPAIAGALGITSEGFDWLCAEVERRVEDGLELLAA